MRALQQLLFCWRGLWMALVTGAILWTARPTPVSLAAGFCLACAGELVRLLAIGHSGQATRKQSLDAPHLVTSGPYAAVRNPLYLGNLLNAAGALVAAHGSDAPLLALLVFLLVAAMYHCIVDLEQKFLLEQFGEEYLDYCRRVPKLWPRRLHLCAWKDARWAHALRHEWTSVFWWLVVWTWLASRV